MGKISSHESSGASIERLSGRIVPISSLWSAWLVLLVSLATSILIWHVAQEDERKFEELEFNVEVRDIESHIRQRMLVYEHALSNAAIFLASSQSVEREEWHVYIHRLAIERFYPGILGIGFSVHLLPEEKNRHIQQARKKGFPAYDIFPEGARNEYTPVTYWEPSAGHNPSAFGYDMFSDPVRRAAMERARDTGNAAISGKVTLLREPGESPQSGFLLYLPVYRNGWPVNTVDQRRAALQGYVFSPFSMNELMAGIIGRNNPGLDIEIYDGTKVSPASVLFDSKTVHRNSPRFSSKAALDVASHHWVLKVDSLPSAASGIAPHHPSIILGLGVAISLLLFAMFRNMAVSRARAFALAERMSANYRESAAHYRKLFDEATDAIALADAETGILIDINQAMERMSGWDKSELIGKSQKILHPPEPMPVSVSASFEQHRSVKDGEPVETPFITKDGAIRNMEIKASSLNLHGRRVLIGFFRDITERKAGEQVIQVQKQFLRQVIDTDPSLIHVKDENGVFLLVNRPLAEAYGMSPEEMIGRKISEINPHVTEVESYLRADREVIQGRGEIRTIECSSMAGTERWFLSIKRPIKMVDGAIAVLGISVDITEQRQAENLLKNLSMLLEERVAALTASEARLAQAQAQAHLGSCSLNLSNNEVLWSDELYRIFGLELHSPLNRDNFLACVHPDDRGRVKETVDAAMASRSEGYCMDYRIILPDGTRRFVYEEGRIFCDEHGKVASIFGTAQDITERKLHEEGLFNANELMERIFANIRTLIAYMDADFNFIRVNQAYAAVDGRSPDYFAGKNHFDLFPNHENEQIFREVVASGQPYVVYAKPFVYEHNQERGVSYWDWAVQPVKDAEGQVNGLVLSLLDRTDEKHVEEKLRLYARALEASDNSILIVDAAQPDFPLVYVNSAFTRVTGYSAEEALGRNPRFLHGNDRDQPELENIRNALRESSSGHAVLRNYSKVGRMFWHELYVSPVLSDSMGVTHFIGVGRDITQRKQVEQALEDSRAQLRGLTSRREEAREEERKHIAREVHDELGSILTGLQMSISAIDFEFATNSPLLSEELQKALELTDVALQVARNIASALRPAVLDMGIVSALEWLVYRFGLTTGIQCEVQIKDNEIQLEANQAIAMFRIVQESLTNVARHAKAERVDIALDWDADNICLKIRDNGAGFDVTNRRPNSFGLLGIRERALMLNWTVSINSHPGAGTEIVVYIPINNNSRKS